MIKDSCNNKCLNNNSCNELNINKKKIEDMIEYNGISKNLPQNSTIFTQFTFNKTLCIPCEKPDIEKIVRLDTKITINDYKVIKTPVGTSLEGQTLTGCKLIVYGTIKQLVMYVANEIDQSVYSAHFEECFCKYIVLPNNFSKLTNLKVIPYIEDVTINESDSRCFCECINIFLDTRLCVQCDGCNNDSCFGQCAKAMGVNENLPQNPLFFKELIIDDTLCIPIEKPDIEGLISITSQIDIISTKLICTENKKSLEGQNLSGCKLIIEYKVKDLVVYTANEVTQPVHSAHYESNLKSTFVVLPCEINGVNIQELLDECKLKINPYIEDICAISKDKRTINRCLTLLIDVEIKCQKY
ncbi:hypothetical protein TPELB_08850 [Terrisporobacter petrolearius]|uniref:SipL SPOCS domain-containing protein n=1 Tax=Terrisporobacter petrolearius TaxID=1460447 RepID=A0ABZ3FB46_9FIRM